MSEPRHPVTPAGPLTRRQLITGAIALGSIAASARLWADTPPEAMPEAPATAANQARTSLHQETSFKATPKRIHEALLDSKQFAAFSGMPARISLKPGGTFSMFGGMIVGRNIESLPGLRLVQAWRPTHWDAGVYSVVRFELKPQGDNTLVVLDHTGFPEGEYDHLYPGWTLRYWDPLRKFLA